jgi:hypothetical protein
MGALVLLQDQIEKIEEASASFLRMITHKGRDILTIYGSAVLRQTLKQICSPSGGWKKTNQALSRKRSKRDG